MSIPKQKSHCMDKNIKQKTECTSSRKISKMGHGLVKALGIHFAINEEESMKLKIKFKKLVEHRGFKKITIFDKISVIKALLESQLVYICIY